MANVIEILINARNNAVGTLNQARSQVQQMNAALSMLSPQAAAAIAPIQGIASAGAALGPAGIAAASFAASVAGIVAVAGAAAAGLKQLGEEAERLSNLSEATGASVTSLQVLSQAMKDAGVDSGVLRIGLRELANNLREGNPALAAMGVTAKDVDGALFQLADAFSVMPDGIAKTTAAAEVLGARSGAQLIPILNKGSAALHELRAEMEATGNLFGSSQPKLVALDNQLDLLARNVDGLRTQLLLMAEPAMSGVLESVNGLFEAVRKARDEFEKFKRVLPLVIDVQVPGASRTLAQINAYIKAIDKLVAARQQFVRGDRDATGRTEDEQRAELPKPIGLKALLEQSTNVRQTLQALSQQSQEFLAALGTSVKEVNRALGVENAAAAKKAQEAADKLAESVRQVNEQLAFVGLGEKGLDQLAGAFARGEVSTAALVQQLGSVARAVEVIQRAEPLLLIEKQAQALAVPLGTNKELARDFADALTKAAQASREIRLDTRGTPPRPDPNAIRPDAPVPQPPDPVTFREFLVTDEIEAWRKLMRQVVEETPTQVAIMRGAFDGLAIGMQQAFRQMWTAAGTLKSIMVSIITSMVNEILAQLARLLAAKFIAAAIGAIIGGPVGAAAGAGAGAAAGAAGGSATRAVGVNTRQVGGAQTIAASRGGAVQLAATSQVTTATVRQRVGGVQTIAARPSLAARDLPPMTLAPAAQRQPVTLGESVRMASSAIPRRDSFAGNEPRRRPWDDGAPRGNTFNIYAFDARDAILQLTSPGGSLRQAFDQVRMAGDY